MKAVEQEADKALEEGDVVREIPRELVPEFVKFFFPRDTSRMAIVKAKHDLEVQRCGIVEGVVNQQEHDVSELSIGKREDHEEVQGLPKCRALE